ncbi:MAG: tetratricopeptide repeat protein [SAR324 cluster bacterium]|uniref:Tetratricopeptide repeat protein n=1 Tax=SAR324 cluster bacterium TaxID=2024889 RepID=A0A7X9FQF3_9DELT|nr:tetratricopeptide repeat protein [SAR324 cluster bacterium]
MEDSDIELKTGELLRQISALSRKGQFAEALVYAQEYSRLCEKIHGLEADETLRSLLSVAKLLMKNSQHEQAIEIFEKARDAASCLSTPNPSIVAYALSGIAACKLAQNNLESAKVSVLAVLNVIEHSSSLIEIQATSEILQDLTEILYSLKGCAELRNIYSTILKITSEIDDENLSSIISKVITAAKWFYQNDDLESANILAEKALQFMSSKTQGEDKDSAELNEIVGLFLLSQGNIDAAEKKRVVTLIT